MKKRICPTCKKSATTKKTIIDKFGFRNMNGVERPQSLCKVCRSKHSHTMKLKRQKNKKLIGKDLRKTIVKKKIIKKKTKKVIKKKKKNK